MMPSLNKQKKGMYDFLLQNSLRTGQSATSVAEGMRPYAEASGQAAAEAGVTATGMARRATEFDEQMAQRDLEFGQGQKNWQQNFDRRNREQDFANMVAIYQQTGVLTPEMMDAFGLSDPSRGDMDKTRQQLDILGIGGGGQGGGNSSSGPLNAANKWGGRTGLVYA